MPLSPCITRIGIVVGVLTMLSAACVHEPVEQALEGSAVALDRTTQPLAVGALYVANGTYGAGCTARSGSWSVRLSGSGSLPNPALSVVQNNTACVLTLTELVADSTYALSPSIAMTGSYPVSPSSVASGSSQFYVSAKLSATSFSGNFSISLAYSDDPAAVTAGVTASYLSVTGSGAAAAVAAPTYTVAFDTAPALDVRVDAGYVVTQVSGKASLTDGATTGTGYVVDLGTLSASPTFADVDAVYNAGSPVTISGANPQVDGTAFSLVGVDLHTAAVRTLVIRNRVSGVSSYQAIRITFSHP